MWADLGSGDGAFTSALAELVGASAMIFSVDKDRSALARQQKATGSRFARAPTSVVHGDFTEPLDLPSLDGLVMANSLHFVADKPPVLALVHGYLKPGGRLIVVEYDVDRGNPWVPYPFSFESWRRIAIENGFGEPALIGRYPSRWLEGLYSAVSTRQ
ncbi:MAG: class I SAM-dependent methyltransferase [Candidatus Dormibacteraeota bacterium]|nr:class I SAM-dependent methyltransferase [Candidatus Dormibacteraeota bacterium]